MTNYQKLRILNSAAVVTATNYNNLLNALSTGRTVTNGIIAKAGTQSGARTLRSDFNIVSTVGLTASNVKLPDALMGMSLTVRNDGLNNLYVYPYETDTINSLALNSPYMMAPGDLHTFDAVDSTRWTTTGLRGATGPTGVVGATGLGYVTPSTSNYQFGASSSIFAALTGGEITVSNSQLLIPNGDVGETTLVNPGNITFLNGSVFAGASSSVIAAAAEANALYTTLSGLTASFTFGATNLELVDAGVGVRRFIPGIYRGTVSITTAATQTIELIGDGDYVFISDAAITFGADTIFLLKNGAKASRIFWVAAGAITTGANNVLKGNFLSPAAVNIGATNDIEGRIMSTIVAAITIDGTATTLNLPTD